MLGWDEGTICSGQENEVRWNLVMPVHTTPYQLRHDTPMPSLQLAALVLGPVKKDHA